jgi:predicted HTH domain antitoxin
MDPIMDIDQEGKDKRSGSCEPACFRTRRVVMETVLSKLDEILVRIGKYPSKEELIEDALRTLIRAKPDLKRDLAIELYAKKEVSLSRAAEICGLNIEDFRALLKERGIKIIVPNIPVEEIDKEVEKILEAV